MRGRPWRVGVAGHDLRFFAPIDGWLRADGAVLRYDRWWGHRQGAPARSEEIAAWADALLCEFCLGNAVTHSRLRRARGGLPARLVVRLHRFELLHRYGNDVDADAVDVFVVPSAHTRRAALAAFDWPADRTVVVPNPVDAAAFDRPKTALARFTLGMAGFNRRVKRLDRALDLLETLWRTDTRWRLRLKGDRPEDDPRFWASADQRRYFTAQYERIAASPALSTGVVFDAFGPVAPWLSGIGYILSPSEVESFHLAAAEGMASRAVPVLAARDGAAEVFDGRWVHASTEAAAAALTRLAADPQARAAQGEAARQLIVARYDVGPIRAAWRHLLTPAALSPTGGTPGEQPGDRPDGPAPSTDRPAR